MSSKPRFWIDEGFYWPTPDLSHSRILKYQISHVALHPASQWGNEMGHMQSNAVDILFSGFPIFSIKILCRNFYRENSCPKPPVWPNWGEVEIVAQKFRCCLTFSPLFGSTSGDDGLTTAEPLWDPNDGRCGPIQTSMALVILSCVSGVYSQLLLLSPEGFTSAGLKCTWGHTSVYDRWDLGISNPPSSPLSRGYLWGISHTISDSFLVATQL